MTEPARSSRRDFVPGFFGLACSAGVGALILLLFALGFGTIRREPELIPDPETVPGDPNSHHPESGSAGRELELGSGVVDAFGAGKAEPSDGRESHRVQLPLRVVSMAGKCPLPGALVLYGREVGDWTHRSTADEEGKVALRWSDDLSMEPDGSSKGFGGFFERESLGEKPSTVRPPRVAVRVSAEGHASLTFVWTWSREERRVSLPEAGELELVFLDDREGAFPGVRAKVLRPGKGEKPRFLPGSSPGARPMTFRGFPREAESGRLDFSVEGTWVREGDVEGRVKWSGLPVGGGYRWRCVSRPDIEVVPKPERPGLTSDEKGVTWVDREPGVSGPFEIRPGEVTRFVVRVASPARVEGRVGGTPVRGVVVKLFRWRHVESDRGGDDVVLHTLADHVEADSGGEFRFHDIEPGEYEVRFIVEERDRSFHFGRARFELEPGETRHLGTLVGREGSVVEGRVVCVEESGEEVDPELLFVPEDGPFVLLSLRGQAEAEGAEIPEVFAEIFRVRIGESFILHGLPRGSIGLALREPPHQPLLLRDSKRRVSFPTEVGLSVPSPTEVRLPVRVLRFRTARLRALFPEGEEGVRCDAFFRHRRTGDVSHAVLRPFSRAIPSAVGQIDLPPGLYEVLIHTMTEGAGTEGPSYFFEGRLDVTEEELEEKVVILKSGAKVFGKVLDADDRPAKDRPFFLTTGVWGEAPEASKRVWVYRARTDEEGRFALRALVPFATLRSPLLDSEIEVGPPGSEVEVVLREAP